MKGFVYTSREDKGPMAGAAPGLLVRLAGRGSPWIVVDHELASVVLARWPGRLWEVDIVDAVTDADLAAMGQSPLR